VPKMPRASWLTIVSTVSGWPATSTTSGVTRVRTANALVPRKRNSRIPAIQVSVRRALFAAGSLNACTPLAIASTPVIAVHPDANALMIRNSDRPAAAIPGPTGQSGRSR